MTAETALHPVCVEVARLVAGIEAHLPCKERAAADLSAPKAVRQAVREQIAEDRVVLTLLGAGRTPIAGTPGTHQDRTETS